MKTTADGRWVMPNVPLSGKARVVLVDPRFVRDDQSLELGPDAAPAPPLIARPGGSIAGKVTFADGKPAQGVWVFVQGTASYNSWGEATTAADGAYRITGLSTATVNVMADDTSGKWVAAALENVQVREGQEVKPGRT